VRLVRLDLSTSRRRLSTVVAGLTVVFGALVVTPACAVSGVPVWPAASELELPAGANTARGQQNVRLDVVTCTSQGNCVAVGRYVDTHGRGDKQAMIATETSGAWGRASKVALPAGASTAAGAQNAVLESVACTSPGNCVAVGSYTDTDTRATTEASGSQDFQAMVVTETSGVWGRASELTLPAGALTPATCESTSSCGIGQAADLESVTCTSAGNCVAVGHYEDANVARQAMVVTETGDVWGQASEVTQPSSADTTASSQAADLEAVTCTSLGNCVAVGYYTDTNDNQQAMLVTETSGMWGRASKVALPAGANTSTNSQEQIASLESVTCTGPESCVAGGYYALAGSDTGGGEAAATQAMLATETGGVWARASKLTLPPGASTSAADEASALGGVTCTSPGSCVAVGAYTEASGSVQAMFATSTGGVWARASELALPAGANTAKDSQDAEFESVACTSPGQCVTVGQYTDGTGSVQGMVLSPVSSLAVLTKESISSARHSAKFSFRAEGDASGFRCALVRVAAGGTHEHPATPRYATCATPKTYAKLAAGSYVFYVRTVGPGAPGKTPASRRFTIA
jgi:hypothetical protein